MEVKRRVIKSCEIEWKKCLRGKVIALNKCIGNEKFSIDNLNHQLRLLKEKVKVSTGK